MCGGEVTIFVEPISTPSLWIFGGGHVSKALCQIAAMTGFRVAVVDDREAYANVERFPDAAETHAAEFAEFVPEMPLAAHTYVVVVTRGHKEDGLVLGALAERFAAGDRPRFLGMIGSRTKRAVLFRQLREAGVAEDFLASVRSPVGMLIGARSHDEIAISIAAELISVRRLSQDAEAAWEARGSRKRPSPCNSQYKFQLFPVHALSMHKCI